MIHLTFLACLMTAPTDCIEHTIRAPDHMPLAVCERTAPASIDTWRRAEAHQGRRWFVARFECERERGA